MTEKQEMQTSSNTALAKNKWQKVYQDLSVDDQDYLDAMESRMFQLQENWQISMGQILTDVHKRLSAYRRGSYVAWLNAHNIPVKSADRLVKRFNFYLDVKGRDNGSELAANLLQLPLGVQDQLASGKVAKPVEHYTLEHISSTPEFRRLSKAYSDEKKAAEEGKKQLQQQKDLVDRLKSQNLDTLSENHALNDQLRKAVQQVKDSSIKIADLEQQLADPTLIQKDPAEVAALRDEINENEDYIDGLEKQLRAAKQEAEELKQHPVEKAPDDYEDLKADNAALRKQLSDFKEVNNLDPRSVTAFKNVVSETPKAEGAVDILSKFAMNADLSTLTPDQVAQTSIPGIVESLSKVEQQLSAAMHNQVLEGQILNE